MPASSGVGLGSTRFPESNGNGARRCFHSFGLVLVVRVNRCSYPKSRTLKRWATPGGIRESVNGRTFYGKDCEGHRIDHCKAASVCLCRYPTLRTDTIRTPESTIRFKLTKMPTYPHLDYPFFLGHAFPYFQSPMSSGHNWIACPVFRMRQTVIGCQRIFQVRDHGCHVNKC